MTVFSFILFLILSVLINITITSFMITRAYHAKKFFTEMEARILEITQNIDAATNEQILLAEENVNRLRTVIKRAGEFYKKLEGHDYKQYTALLEQIKKLNKKIQKQSVNTSEKSLPLKTNSSHHYGSSVTAHAGSLLLASEGSPQNIGSKKKTSDAEELQSEREKGSRLSLDEHELLKLKIRS